MKPIGGYIELQLPVGEEYYPSLIKLNTGRNSLEYILLVKGYRTIYLPYFTCDVLLEPIKHLGIKLKYYHIDSNLDPIIDFELGPTDCIVYTNYFGLKQDTVNRLSTYIDNLIIDNSQAFFSEPLPHVDTFYSCRKFFGVPDGAYLHLNTYTRLNVQSDVSIERFSHLIKSIDLSIEDGYTDYIENNKALESNSIRSMSSLTRKILSGINYEECKAKRNANFKFLHSFLEESNQLKFPGLEINGPMTYPFLVADPSIKEKLIERKIFVPTFWPNVFHWASKGMFEYYLANNLVSLPIDHRYNLDDMTRILNNLTQLI